MNEAKRRGKDYVMLISLIGVFTALDFVLARFASFPIFNGDGYFNLSDILVFLLSALINPWVGGLVGGISGLLSDLSQGYIYYAPFTFFIKLLEGALAGYIYSWLARNGKTTKRGTWLKGFIAFLTGGILMAILYMIPDGIVYLIPESIAQGNYIIIFVDLGFNFLQGVVNALLAASLFVGLANSSFLFDRFKLKSKGEEKEKLSVEEEEKGKDK